MLLLREHIEQHFILNEHWKNIFLLSFPNWTPETWEKDAWSIFERNNYRYEIERYSENPKSNLYDAVKCISIFDKSLETETTDGFIIGYGDLTYENSLQQLLIGVICNFEVDIRKFK